MKTLSNDLAAHIAAPVTTLAWCWKVQRADGTVFGFTDHDTNLAFDGVTYTAATGFTATEIASSQGLSIDNLDIDGALDATAITEADLRGGRYDNADVEIWRVNWADTAERVLIRKGTIGEVTRGELGFRAELRGLAHALDQTQGRTYQRQCDANVGDARCGVDLDTNAFRGTGTVTAVADDRVLTVAAFPEGTFAEQWFRHGKLTWTAGDNTGLSAEVKSHYDVAGGVVIELYQRAAFGVSTGDTFKVFAGCDKIWETCKATFANTANFRGFPHLPGNDKAFAYVVGQDGENDGGSFFA